MKLFLIGTGLIGGSMSKDLRNLIDKIQIHGIDKNQINIKYAKDIGMIDNIDNLENLNKADRVILSIPVSESLKVLPFILDNLHKNALVWDVGSTKFNLCKSVERHPKRNQFLATHPIAGNEFSGPEASIENLFNGKDMITTSLGFIMCISIDPPDDAKDDNGATVDGDGIGYTIIAMDETAKNKYFLTYDGISGTIE